MQKFNSNGTQYQPVMNDSYVDYVIHKITNHLEVLLI
jgi:hypothetical protein